MRACRTSIGRHHRIGQLFERRDDLFAEPLHRLAQLRRFRNPDGFSPERDAVPAPGQGLILQAVDGGFLVAHQAGLERAKPIIVLPAEGHQPQPAARQLGKRVVRDGFPAIKEHRDLIPIENPAYGVVIGFQGSDQHRHVSEPAVFKADVTADFMRDAFRLGFGISARDDADGRSRNPGYRGIWSARKS